MRSARPRSRTVRRAIVAAAATLALGGCGDDPENPSAEPVGQETAGSVAPLAQCRDWNRGSAAEKLATIEEIRRQVNLEDSGVEAPPLSDDEAMRMFENACSQVYADGFRLYVLYARAAGFAPLTR